MAAVTLTHLWTTPDKLAYLAETGGAGAGAASVNCDALGAGTPDLLTDTAEPAAEGGTGTLTNQKGSRPIGVLMRTPFAAAINAQRAFGVGAGGSSPDPQGSIQVIPRDRAGGAALANFGATVSVNGTALRLTVSALDDGANVLRAIIILKRTPSTGK